MVQGTRQSNGGISQTPSDVSPAAFPLQVNPASASRYSGRFTFRLFAHLLAHTCHEVPASALSKRALIFSPHPDDECLGCGGTILKKKQAGAVVKLIHMTDGSGSHPHLMSKQGLKAIRMIEARNAAKLLGVDDIFYLDFPDSALSENLASGSTRVAEILHREQPEEVFVPHRLEPNRQAADHNAATNIVMSALRSYARPVTVWEYPVWFWLHWPWISLNQKNCGAIKTRHVARNSLRLLLGLRTFAELRSSVSISDVLPRKAMALAEHRSQMTQLVPDPAWSTLSDVSGGQFLNCFQFEREFFRISKYASMV
jgi:LmbE family N-acetylglucosaminyl deacetylase